MSPLEATGCKSPKTQPAVACRVADTLLCFLQDKFFLLETQSRVAWLFEGKRIDLLSPTASIHDIPTSIYVHAHYKYLFEATFDETDDEGFRKYDEIVEDVQSLLEKHPGYRLYVTGHSLGGGLANLVSFFLACGERFPKPITCITAAAPRVADWNFLWAVQVLEQNRQLRCIRVVNDKDVVPLLPLFGYYHAGFRVRLYRTDSDDEVPRAPEVTYPKLADNWQNRWSRTWENSVMVNLDMRYDHSDYRERVTKSRIHLEQLDLNQMYQRED